MDPQPLSDYGKGEDRDLVHLPRMDSSVPPLPDRSEKLNRTSMVYAAQSLFGVAKKMY
jgi:hypothetical protein